MRFLDCFCGLGGASEGFAREGFECVGIEINPEIAKLYPYDCIVADIRTLDGTRFEGFDVIWGSPPCRDFTQLPDHHVTKKGIVKRIELKAFSHPRKGGIIASSGSAPGF